jgi:DNA-binding GntR family transcriptional regulator
MAVGRTKSGDTYEVLRADILAGRIRPGERLPFAPLVERYGTSVGAIREVLMRLSEQGLVRAEPQQGFLVTPLSTDDLQDLTDARCELEGLVVARAVAEGDVTWESQLVAAHHLLDRTPFADSDDPSRLSERWATVHASFHSALLNGCTNKRLVSIAAGLRDSAELYRRWSFAVEKDGDRDIAKEHRSILEAVLVRDAELARKLLIKHISTTTEFLLRDSPADEELRAALLG